MSCGRQNSVAVQLITATGCALTAVMAAFLAVALSERDALSAVAHAAAIYGCQPGLFPPSRA